jgi:uncharacterized protein (TIGR03435 family)
MEHASGAVSECVQQELGFKIERRKLSLEVLAVDRAERIPKGN